MNISLLLAGAVLFLSLASCKGNGNKGNDQGTNGGKNFNVKFIKLWTEDVTDKENGDSVNVKGGAEDHDLKVKVEGCDNYKLTVSVDGEASSADSSLGVATIRDLDIPATKAGAELVIKLTADGMNEYRKSLTIKRNDSSANVTVTAKLATTEAAIAVENDRKYETEMESVNVEVVSAVDIATVKIAGEDATLDGTKKASKLIRVGEVGASVEVNVELTFKYHKAFTTKFKLERVASGQRPIAPVKVTLYSGENYGTAHEMKLENGVYTCDALDDIEYSVVKLVMEMNGTPTKAEIIAHKDDRSATYDGEPTKEDMEGIFSGRIKEEIDAKGVSTVLNPLRDNIYTEYLVVGAGKVSYEFSFEAVNRVNTKKTITINNANKNKFSLPQSDQTCLFGSGYFPYALILQTNFFQWVGYKAEPINQKGQPWLEANQNLEYMGDFVEMNFTFAPEKVENSIVYFCYNLYENRDTEKCPEFVRIAGKVRSDKKQVVNAKFNPMEKYVDAFVATKKMLPILSLPYSLKKPWKKIVKKGFTFHIENSITVKGNEALDPYYDVLTVCSYRNLSKIYEKNNKNHTSEVVPVKIGKKQKYKENLNGAEQQLKSSFLEGGTKDNFILVPTFLSTDKETLADHFSSVKYSIKKEQGNSDQTWDSVSGYDNVEVEELSKYRGVLLRKKESELNFEDNNVYRIEVETTLKDGTTKEYFDYQIYYTDDEQTMDNYETDSDYSGDLFGVPFDMEAIEASQFSAIREELAREAVFAR